jgi:gliding motility-associated-like protein
VLENNGCSNPIVKSNILVIDYPRFFTPNGDGYNESWNILSLRDDASAKFEFDRYGKLLKELTPNSGGWNGLYIGQPMPSDDYWFVVDIQKKVS